MIRVAGAVCQQGEPMDRRVGLILWSTSGTNQLTGTPRERHCDSDAAVQTCCNRQHVDDSRPNSIPCVRLSSALCLVPNTKQGQPDCISDVPRRAVTRRFSLDTERRISVFSTSCTLLRFLSNGLRARGEASNSALTTLKHKSQKKKTEQESLSWFYGPVCCTARRSLLL